MFASSRRTVSAAALAVGLLAALIQYQDTDTVFPGFSGIAYAVAVIWFVVSIFALALVARGEIVTGLNLLAVILFVFLVLLSRTQVVDFYSTQPFWLGLLLVVWPIIEFANAFVPVWI